MISFVSFLTATAALIFAFRVFDFSMLMRAHWLVDIIVTAVLMMFFSGTLQGTVIAAIAGLIFSIFMSLGRVAQKGISNVKAYRPANGVRISDRNAHAARRAELDKILDLIKPSDERKHRPQLLRH